MIASEPDLPRGRTEPWDVVVIGAGPAGATAALHLAGRGRDVLLVDRHAFPRDKACGDGLIPDALRCLGRAGLERRVRRAGYEMREAAAFGPSRDEVRIRTDFVGLKRLDLDALIVREAVQRGATLHRDRITGVAVAPTGGVVLAEARDGDAPIRARYALVATGADASLLR
ncbi:MAG: NAD(P)/FAD-dependent oxidoreductase, partial [Gemmatimonadota bacterium]